ncbi:hypothetical protein AOT82_9 [Psychrobacter sp. AntiMn-1]|nr:hypothetical protein AOT82_9 [Psychrobacter sp. AntiMn-1]
MEGHTDNIPVSQPVTDYQRFAQYMMTTILYQLQELERHANS